MVNQGPKNMQEAILAFVPSGTVGEVEHIVQCLPAVRWRDVFKALHDLNLEGRIILEQRWDDSTVVARQVRLNRRDHTFQRVRMSPFTERDSLKRQS